MKLTKEVKTGGIVLITFGMLVWGINFLKGRDIFFRGDIYYGIYPKVDGLTDASPVYYKGFKVGSVRDIEIHPEKQDRFLVTFAIHKQVKFPKNTQAEIYSLDLMGSKGVQFIPVDSQGLLMPGDTLASSVMGDFVDQMSIQVLPLKEKTEKLIVKLDSTLTKLSLFFDASTQRHFASSVANLDKSLGNLADITDVVSRQLTEGGNIDNSLKRMDALTATLSSRREKIGTGIDNFVEISNQMKGAELDKAITELKNTLNETTAILAGINQGEGSVGMFLHDKQLYNRLADASESLDRLLLDVKENPKRYVHFSLIDFGDNVRTRKSAEGVDGIVFQVLVAESKKTLGIAGKEVEPGLRIYEDYDGTKFFYVVGLYRTFGEAELLMNRIKDLYPQAEVIALENGKPIRLGKAKRTTNSH
ncbi:MAG: MlaD family protein [Breznakibacter sp.]